MSIYPQVKAARIIAKLAHADQVRRFCEEPYWKHPERVAEAVKAELFITHDYAPPTYDEIVAAAWLHDVVEDTWIEFVDLLDLGFNEDVIEAVRAVTRQPGETYRDFVTRAAAHPNGRLIKRMDVQDNLQGLPEGHKLHDRYRLAMEILDAAADSSS